MQGEDENNFDLYLEILHPNDGSRDNKNDVGDHGRQVENNCYSSLVPPASELYDFILRGRAGYGEYTPIFMLNAVPTMIEEGPTRYVVFSHAPKKVAKQDNEKRFVSRTALYFYDVDASKVVKRIKGGEALVNYDNAKETDGAEEWVDTEKSLMFLGNGWLMKENIWKDKLPEDFNTKKAGELYEDSVTQDKCQAVVISIKVNLKDGDAVDLIEPDGDGRLLEGFDEAEYAKTKSWDATAKLVGPNNISKVFFIDVKDTDGIFGQRYLRQNPVSIVPHGGRNKEGVTQAFTILFAHVCAFTFSNIVVPGQVTKELKE